MIFRRKAAAVVPSMAAGSHLCLQAGGNALDELAGFRQAMYGCLWRRAVSRRAAGG